MNRESFVPIISIFTQNAHKVIINKTEKPFSLQDDEKEGTIMTELVNFLVQISNSLRNCLSNSLSNHLRNCLSNYLSKQLCNHLSNNLE